MPKQMLDTVQVRSGFAFVPEASTAMRWSDEEAEKFDRWLAEHDRQEREKAEAPLRAAIHAALIVDHTEWDPEKVINGMRRVLLAVQEPNVVRPGGCRYAPIAGQDVDINGDVWPGSDYEKHLASPEHAAELSSHVSPQIGAKRERLHLPWMRRR
jgi:hypothetical protein